MKYVEFCIKICMKIYFFVYNIAGQESGHLCEKRVAGSTHFRCARVDVCVCVHACESARARVGFGCWECVYGVMWARASGVYVWMSVCVCAHARMSVCVRIGVSLM